MTRHNPHLHPCPQRTTIIAEALIVAIAVLLVSIYGLTAYQNYSDAQEHAQLVAQIASAEQELRDRQAEVARVNGLYQQIEGETAEMQRSLDYVTRERDEILKISHVSEESSGVEGHAEKGDHGMPHGGNVEPLAQPQHRSANSGDEHVGKAQAHLSLIESRNQARPALTPSPWGKSTGNPFDELRECGN